jgi:cyclopropane fatty-acyl-phospholipid synthase-like methyltransferase
MNKHSATSNHIFDASTLPFSQACENNKQPILDVLQQALQESNHVLEVGSGTGQHSVYLAPRLAHLTWQTSDVLAHHATINAWHTAYPASNLYAPLAFDLAVDPLPINFANNQPYDAVFTANTLHIISWSLVEKLFELVGNALPINGKLIIYGPFNENGHYTSAGNQQFDISLRQRDPKSGIRHLEDIIDLAKTHQLRLADKYMMPANNQILVFEKH